MKKTNRKHIVKILILLLFALVSCKKSYPITAYDTDLKKEERSEIVKLYEKNLAYEESLRNKKKDENIEGADLITEEETKGKGKYEAEDAYIDDDYISSENRIEDNKLNNDANTAYTTNNNSNATNDFPVVVLFKNQPDFDLTQYKAESFENYSDLDSLGRVGKAEAMLGKDTMPTSKRESIGMIKPAGWHTIKYDGIDGNYLYNRCHLIGWQLSAENANEKNLFTGTRYLNVQGMLPFENQVANYIKQTGNHVLYRVTPYYSGNNLLLSHIQIEAMSFEDKGQGICFNVKLDNIQPGIYINYADGNSHVELSNDKI